MAATTELIVDHRIHLFFDFAFVDRSIADRLTALKVEDVAAPGWIDPSRIDDAAQRRVSEKPVWYWSEWTVSSDLHQYVRELLDSRMQGTTGESPHCLRLSEHAVNLVSGRYRRPPLDARGAQDSPQSGLAVIFGANARIEALLSPPGDDVARGPASVVSLPLEFEGMSVHLFRTGIGLAVATLSLVDAAKIGLRPELLIETIPRLSDERRAPALGWREDDAAPGSERFSMGRVARMLLEPAGCRVVERERVYSFCGLAVGGPLPDVRRREIGFRLSRHYNATYRPTGDFEGSVFVQPFETVLHAASREGASTVINASPQEPAGDAPEFLRSWMSNVHARVYLPLQVATLHEHVALLDLAEGAGRQVGVAQTVQEEVDALQSLCDRGLAFRLGYRLAQVSSITMHDLVYVAAAKALGLETLTEKISTDLVAVERRLIEVAENSERAADRARAARERQFARSFAWFAGFGSGGLAYLTFTTAVGHIVDALKVQSQSSVAVIQSVGIALALIAGYYTWGRQRAGSQEFEELARHASVEVTNEASMSHSGSKGDSDLFRDGNIPRSSTSGSGDPGSSR